MIVSGLPRSGTSLMMQMLAAGGMPVLTDHERAPDAGNPRGYFEWEAIKRIGKEPELLDDEALNGHAVKCISMLLPKLPAKHDYKVIFMTRPIEEVVRSQRAMITRLNTQGAALDEEQLRRGLAAHREEVRKWLSAAPHIEWIEIDTELSSMRRRALFKRWSNSSALNSCLRARRWARSSTVRFTASANQHVGRGR